jgi:hypothetical protein
MVADVVVSVGSYFVTKYASPETTKDVLFMIGALQPVVLLVIGSLTVQNVAEIKAQSALDEAAEYSNYKEI